MPLQLGDSARAAPYRKSSAECKAYSENRFLSLLKLAPTVFGAMIAAMIGVGPAEAELNFCKWVSMLASIEPACLHGLPSEALWSVAILLIAVGLIWFLWPYRSTIAKIILMEPIHIILVGLLVSLIGVAWHFYRTPQKNLSYKETKEIAAPLLAEINALKSQLAAKPKINVTAEPGPPKYSIAQVRKILEAIDALYGPLLSIERSLDFGLGLAGSLEANIRDKGLSGTMQLFDDLRLQLIPPSDALNKTVADYGLYKEACDIVDERNIFHDKFFESYNELMGILRVMPDQLSESAIRAFVQDKKQAFVVATKSYLTWTQQKKRELEGKRQQFLTRDTTD